ALMLKDYLEDLGHRVEVAHDGAEALTVATAHPFDVAVVDIGLPVMDGYELAERIGGQLGAARPRLVALTGYGQPHDRERALAAGFDEHLVKPVDPEALVRAIGVREPRDGATA